MKTLLIISLLILPLLMSGQDTTVISGHQKGEDIPTIYIPNVDITKYKTSNAPLIQDAIIYTTQLTFNEKLLTVLTEYETDCYNDSNKVWIEVPYALKPGIYPSGYKHMDLKWIHKQPTFPDFIKWLRKKSEQGGVN